MRSVVVTARCVVVAVFGCLFGFLFGCGADDDGDDDDDGRVTLVVAGSALGKEGDALRALADEFGAARGVDVVVRGTPDGADDRHQLYVQWLNAGSKTPDVLQIDVVWVAEFQSAGFIVPVDVDGLYGDDLFDGVRASVVSGGVAWAAPWFVDVGMLYRRTDLVPAAPLTFDDLERDAGAGGYVWQGARYEGLVCVFLEVMGGEGGALVDDDGVVSVDDDAGVRALSRLQRWVGTTSPAAVVSMQEEQARFAFQNGGARLMRNWPYAKALVDDGALRGKIGVSPLPRSSSALGARATATLGGGALAISAHSEHKDVAADFVRFVTTKQALLARARATGHLPPRPSLYVDDSGLADAVGLDVDDARAVVAAATPRPVTPLWAELSALLQVELHRALTGQATAQQALSAAATKMRALQASRPTTTTTTTPATNAATPNAATPATPNAATPAPQRPPPVRAALVVVAVAVIGALALLLRRRRVGDDGDDEPRLAWALSLPTLTVLAVCAAVPLALTVWESFFDRDLRFAARGAPFVGVDGYRDVFVDDRFAAALGHTLFFTVTTVGLELTLGLALALVLHKAFVGRGLVRAAVLVPWAMPTVVAGVLWRFAFDGPLLADAHGAWLPLIVADVWKTTPFVALLLLAGLAGIDDAVYEAAAVDGASAWQRLTRITLPLLAPSLLVCVVFRALDAVRVFDLVVVVTGGGPGTATEPLTLLTFDAFLRALRFGEGAVLSVIVFALTMTLATIFVRLLERR